MSEIIVRIAGEGRWRLNGHPAQKVVDDDRWLTRAVDDERDVEYQYLLVALCRYVRKNGKRISSAPGDADITIPAPGMSLDETIELLSERRGLDLNPDAD